MEKVSENQVMTTVTPKVQEMVEAKDTKMGILTENLAEEPKDMTKDIKKDMTKDTETEKQTPLIDPEKLESLRAELEQARQEYEKGVDSFWHGLSYEDRLKAFYAVTKLIYKADVEDRGSYRYALYDVFGFGADAYIIGMDSHYFDLHNLLFDAINKRKGEEYVEL